MKIYVSASANGWGNGTRKFPFLTISEAAKIACPGDEVVVAPGIYRECVDPARAGTEAVSYTHLDVYKRQTLGTTMSMRS